MATRASRPDELLDPVLDFMRLLWRLEHALQATSKQMDRRLGMTGPQRLVLRLVARFPEISAGDVARILHLHPSTITGILKRLADKRLLVRERDPLDTRRVRLRPGPQAAGRVRRTAGTVEAAVARVLARTAAVQIRHARAVLDALGGEIENLR